MESCWKASPDDRPTAAQVLRELRDPTILAGSVEDKLGLAAAVKDCRNLFETKPAAIVDNLFTTLQVLGKSESVASLACSHLAEWIGYRGEFA